MQSNLWQLRTILLSNNLWKQVSTSSNMLWKHSHIFDTRHDTLQSNMLLKPKIFESLYGVMRERVFLIRKQCCYWANANNSTQMSRKYWILWFNGVQLTIGQYMCVQWKFGVWRVWRTNYTIYFFKQCTYIHHLALKW